MIFQMSYGSQRGFLSSGLVQSDGRPLSIPRLGSRERLETAAHELTIQHCAFLSFPSSVGLRCFYRVETYAYLHTFVFLKVCYFVNTLLCFTVYL